LFNLYVAAVMLTWKKVKPTPSMEFLTDTSDAFILHGRTGVGVAFAFDYDLYADDTAGLGESRPDLSFDMAALCPHFVRFAMNVHQGQDGKNPNPSLCFLPDRLRCVGMQDLPQAIGTLPQLKNSLVNMTSSISPPSSSIPLNVPA
jgi:hypothetical protein